MWIIGRLRDEGGIAVITALLVTMVVVVLGLASVTIAVHNIEGSSYDRRRVQAISAAEAGIDYYFSHLQSVAPADVQCSIEKTLAGQPPTRFTVSATFYDGSSNVVACPPVSTIPTTTLIHSEGQMASGLAPVRVMEAFVDLVPVRGAPIGNTALFSNVSPNFASNVIVQGSTSQNGNVYTNGDITVSSNTVISGSLYAQGNATLNSNAQVKRDFWAKGAATLESYAQVFGNLTSSTSTVTLRTNSHAYGDVRAGTTITNQGTIDGLQITNSPSSPPPELSFPAFEFLADEWAEDGYTLTTFSDCTAARTFLYGITGGKHVVRITSACTLTLNGDLTVRDDLGIVSDGALQVNANSDLLNSGPTHRLHLIFGLGGAPPCDINFEANTSIVSDLNVLLYTPCTVRNRSNSFVLQGQIFAGFVDFRSNATINYIPIDVPGVGASHFDEDIVYLREVVAA